MYNFPDFRKVMVSTSGSQLLPSAAIRQLRELLFPYTTVLTPNVPEAQLLLSDAGKSVEEPKNLDDLKEIAKAVQSLGPRYVLVKGGHLPLQKDGTVATKEEEKELMVDILYGEGVITEIRTRYQKSRNTHGTGCSMACEFIHIYLAKQKLNRSSRHCFEHCERITRGTSCEKCLPIYRSRNTNSTGSRERQWSD